MPASQERRSFRRYPIRVPVLQHPSDLIPTGPAVGWTRNLSQTGACVELSGPLQPRMPLRLRLQTDSGPVDMEAHVAWAGEHETAEGDILHGMAFTKIPPHQLQTLRDLIICKGVGRPGGVRLPFDVPVKCQPSGAPEPVQGRTHDISRGGLLLRLARVVPPGTLMEVTLYTPNWEHTVQGTVVWVAPPEGRTPGGPIRHGFRFTAISRSTTLALSHLLVVPG